MLTRHLFLPLGVITTLCACGNEDSTAPRPSMIPTGVTWTLKCIRFPSNEHSCNENGLDQQYTLRFNENGTVSGTNACNNCIGTYSYVSAAQLEIRWSCTGLACGTPPPWLGYGDYVANTTSFALVNEELVLTFVVRGEEFKLSPPLRPESGAVYLEMVYQQRE